MTRPEEEMVSDSLQTYTFVLEKLKLYPSCELQELSYFALAPPFFGAEELELLLALLEEAEASDCPRDKRLGLLPNWRR